MLDGSLGTTYVPRKQTVSPWRPWFAWRPVKVNGQTIWLQRIYRRCINAYVDMDDWKRYKYGTIFNITKGD